MRTRLLALILLHCFGRFVAAAAEFPDHNFAIDLPKDWEPIESLPAPIVAAVRTSDGSKTFMAGATKLPANERSNGVRNVVEGAKKALTDKKFTIDPERQEQLGGLTFTVFTAHPPAGGSATMYTAVAGEEAYTLNSYSAKGDSVADPELKTAFQSFRLLSPAAPPRSRELAGAGAYRAGYIAGRITVFILLGAAAVVVVLLLRRKSN